MIKAERFGRVRQQGWSQLPTLMSHSRHPNVQLRAHFWKIILWQTGSWRAGRLASSMVACDVAGVSQEQVRRRPRRAQVGPPLRLSVSENWRESEKNVKYARIIYRIDGKATLVTLHGGGRRAEQDKIAPSRSPSFIRPLVLPFHHAHTCPSLPRVFPAFVLWE